MMKQIAPIAERIPHFVKFGRVKGQNRGKDAFEKVRTIKDDYFWLRDDERKNEKVLNHLKKENEYAKSQTAHLENLRQCLYKEHLSHLKETDDEAPWVHGDFWYFSKTIEGKSYKIYCRRKRLKNDERLMSDKIAGPVETLLDVNVLAKDLKHCDVKSFVTSPDHNVCAFALDATGDEVYEIRVLDLKSKTFVKDDSLPKQAVGSVRFGKDAGTLFFMTQDETKRPYRLYRHKVGSKQKPELLFEENDPQFWLGMWKSRCGDFLFAQTASTETSEVHALNLSDENALLRVIQPRQFGLRYDVAHDPRTKSFIVVTNKDKSLNNRIMITSTSKPNMSNWIEFLPHSESRRLDDVYVFKNHLVIEGREESLPQVWVVRRGDDDDVFDAKTLSRVKLGVDGELCDVSVSRNYEFSTDFLNLSYSSLTTPKKVLDMNMNDFSNIHVIKTTPVLNFDSNLYTSRRFFATAPDKTQIPMSLVCRKDVWDLKSDPKSPMPLHLYGYGSYGISIDPYFRRDILPLLDRGMIFCIAHIRGGGENGRYWYEAEGKYLMKRNTFSDFVACAEMLVEKKITSPKIMSCEGRSAGGLLMGNVINMRPDLFKCAVAGVPFVDLMVTMCDPSIPLTTNEWEEWGNPNEPKYFDYMLSYSPIDQVRAQPYPDVLITAGLHDPRVAYWEPAKWASKLRTYKTSEDSVVICKFDLSAGHFSASDRYRWVREKCYDQSFILDRLGLKDAKTKAKTSDSKEYKEEKEARL